MSAQQDFPECTTSTLAEAQLPAAAAVFFASVHGHAQTPVIVDVPEPRAKPTPPS